MRANYSPVRHDRRRHTRHRERPLRRELTEAALALGFHSARFTSVSALPHERFARFVADAQQGEMSWLADSMALRVDARQVLASAKSAMVLRWDYGGARPNKPGPTFGRVASYAWGRDYHNLIGRRLRKLQAKLGDAGVRAYASCDSRPVWERAWAERAGLGFAAKNGCILTPAQGSTYFIAVVLVNIDLGDDGPIAPRCGACTRCIDVCPTAALPGDGRLIVPRCISYLTIESDTAIPLELRPKLGDWVYGCDDCQDVCPHQPQLRPDPHPDLRAHNAWLDLELVLDTPDDWLTAVTTGSPLRRASPHRLKRNAAVVLGNFAPESPALLRAADHVHPLVSEAARWALERSA